MIPATAFRSDECFTQRQFRRWVDQRAQCDINRYELLRGQIVMTPPAGWTHGRIGARLVSLFEEHVTGSKLGVVLDSSAGYDLPSGDTVEPDVSYVSSERFHARPPTRPDQFLRVVPNLVVEILSPATAKRDQVEKKAIYEANGVDEYWIVDSRRKSVTVFHLEKGQYHARRMYARGSARSRVLPKLRVSLARLFAV